jgi:carbonic anhydrase/acetyltransferase-like protein (isoleucine patch superfamily)
MPVIPHHGVHPTIHPSVFVAEGACVIGDVRLGVGVSVWFNAVLRGDINIIRVGDRTNIQDGAVLHVTHELPVTIGADVTVGHHAVVHACTIGDCSLIGMNAVVLDNARVGPYAIVAAGCVVRENFVVPEGVLVAGVPGRIVRPLTEDERTQLKASALHYTQYAQSFFEPVTAGEGR